MRASVRLKTVAVRQKWEQGETLRELVAQGDGVTLIMPAPENRQPDTLAKKYPEWLLDLRTPDEKASPEPPYEGTAQPSTSTGVQVPSTQAKASTGLSGASNDVPAGQRG